MTYRTPSARRFGCLTLTSIILLVGCSSSHDRAPEIDTSGTAPATNRNGAGSADSATTLQDGGLGDGGSDGAIDSGATSSVDGGSTVQLTGQVRLLQSFTQPLIAVDLQTLGTSTFVLVSRGGTQLQVPVSTTGDFSVEAMDVTTGLTFVPVAARGLVGTEPVTRSLRGLGLVAGATYSGVLLPLYPFELAQVTAAQVGAARANPATIVTAGRGTLVVHVLDQDAQPVAGVTASALSAGEGPFYDNGLDGFSDVGPTRAAGTLLWLGIDLSRAGGSVQVVITQNGVVHTLPTLPIAPDAVTYHELSL